MDAELRIGRTADVEQRHRHHVLVVIVEFEGAGIEGVRDQVRLSEPDALGLSGGARGVHDHAHVVRRDVGATTARCRGGEHRLVLVALGALRGDLDDVGDGGQPVADGLDARLEFGADDQQCGPGVVEHVVRLIAGQPEIDDRRRRSQRRRGNGGLDARRVVLVQEGHHVAAADAALRQGPGAAADAIVELSPGPGAAQVGDGDAGRFGLGPVRRAVVEETGIVRLRHRR